MDLPHFSGFGFESTFWQRPYIKGLRTAKIRSQPYSHFPTPTANPKPWLIEILLEAWHCNRSTFQSSNSLDSWIAASGIHHVPKTSTCFNHWWLPTFSKLPVVQGDHIHLRYERFEMLKAQKEVTADWRCWSWADAVFIYNKRNLCAFRGWNMLKQKAPSWKMQIITNQKQRWKALMRHAAGDGTVLKSWNPLLTKWCQK